MHDSITMAVVGSMVKVSGSRIATPFGPPRPGNTPTKTPSTRPTIMKASVLNVSRTPNPRSSRPNASIALLSAHPGCGEPRFALLSCICAFPYRKTGLHLAGHALIAERRFHRAFRHDDVEREVEG